MTEAKQDARRDPRWEWYEISTFDGEPVRWVKGRCLHTEVEPVESDGQTVAHLCRTCDQQLPEEWRTT